MSGKVKRKNYGDIDASNGGSDGGGNSPPPKKPAKVEKKTEEDIIICELSKNKRVSKKTWQGKVLLDIREYYLKDGKQFPGKKGISLTVDQWKVFRDNFKEIDQAVAENA